MAGSTQRGAAKGMRWAARAIGLLAAVLILVMVIASAVGEAVTEGWGVANRAELIQGALIGVLGVLGLAGCIVSWWRLRLAGLLLVLTSIGFAIHIGILAGHNHVVAWSMLGLPFLVAAALLFISWRLSAQTA